MKSLKIILLILLLIPVVFFVLKLKTQNKEDGTILALQRIQIIDNEMDICIGDRDAPVKIVLFYNYACGHCIRFFSETLPLLKKKHLDKKRAKLILKPVNLTHNATVSKALETLYCLDRLGEVEKMHQLLVLDYTVVYSSDFDIFVNDLMQKNEELAHCLSQHEAMGIIQQNNDELSALRLGGTPTFVIGNSVYKGALNYRTLNKIIKKELEKHKKKRQNT